MTPKTGKTLVEKLLADTQMVTMPDNPGISEYRTRPISKEAANAITELKAKLKRCRQHEWHRR